MKAIKANNPLYIGQLAKRIQEYHRRIAIPGITYETLYSYFTGVIQHGREAAEFWMVLDDADPLGFAVFTVMPIPYIGTVHFDHIYVWGKEKGTSGLLVDEFVKFSERHNAVLGDITARNKATYRLFKRMVEKKGFAVVDNESVNFIARR